MRLAAIHSLTDTSPATPRNSAVLAPAHRGPLARLLARLLVAAQNWLARRAVLAELHELDDRTLADLCIYPGDFPAIAEGSYVREGGAHDRQAPR